VKTAGTITTSGQGSTAVLVQSVGGGGGNAGFGSGNTQRFGTGDYAASVNVTLGATGGAGGNGGAVWVYLFPGNGITTYGSGAIGVLGQSIGGGGASRGGSFTRKRRLTSALQATAAALAATLRYPHRRRSRPMAATRPASSRSRSAVAADLAGRPGRTPRQTTRSSRPWQRAKEKALSSPTSKVGIARGVGGAAARQTKTHTNGPTPTDRPEIRAVGITSSTSRSATRRCRGSRRKCSASSFSGAAKCDWAVIWSNGPHPR
jgi:hypothetical protein